MRPISFFFAASLLTIPVLLASACADSVTGFGGTGTSGGGASGSGTGSASGSGGNGGDGGDAAGTSTGTVGAGGAGGASSASGGAGGEGGYEPATAMCLVPEDCRLINDCCTCSAIPAADPDPECGLNCLFPTCDSIGAGKLEVGCEAGRCVAGFPCDHNKAECDGLPPVCPPGETALLSDEGCYGSCVPADQCATVGSCEQCNAAGHLCVTQVTHFGPKHHCVPVPPVCQGSADCACMGAAVCVEPFDTCADTSDGVTCSCINC